MINENLQTVLPGVVNDVQDSVSVFEPEQFPPDGMHSLVFNSCPLLQIPCDHSPHTYNCSVLP